MEEDQVPFMLNGCYTWSPQSPIVKEDFPKFYEAPASVEVRDIDVIESNS